MTLTICRDNSSRDIGPVDYNQINLKDAIRTRQQTCKLLSYGEPRMHESCIKAACVGSTGREGQRDILLTRSKITLDKVRVTLTWDLGFSSLSLFRLHCHILILFIYLLLLLLLLQQLVLQTYIIISFSYLCFPTSMAKNSQCITILC